MNMDLKVTPSLRRAAEAALRDWGYSVDHGSRPHRGPWICSKSGKHLRVALRTTANRWFSWASGFTDVDLVVVTALKPGEKGNLHHDKVDAFLFAAPKMQATFQEARQNRDGTPDRIDTFWLCLDPLPGTHRLETDGNVRGKAIKCAELSWPGQAPAAADAPAGKTPPKASGSVAPLSISDAKAGLAAFYGVNQETIEIVIRG